MYEYNKLQINYIRCFAKIMNIKDENEAALEWVRIGLALEFSKQFRH